MKKATTCPIFHNSYPVFGDFLISVAGVGPIPQQEKKKDAEAQPKCLKLKVAQLVFILHRQLARTHTQTVTCGGSG